MPDRALRRGAGVAQILRFNAPRYVAAVAVVALGLASGTLAGQVAAAVALWFTLASLAASLWVYDLSDLYGWRWVPTVLGSRPTEWVAVTTGFDQSTRTLSECLPSDAAVRVDLFDDARTTEPSARRARRFTDAVGIPTLTGAPGALPVDTDAADAVFLLFAVHELRRAEDRRALFGEVARVLRPGGRALIVEHARDIANALAFGPGALHFLPAREWNAAPAAAGLELVSEERRTPFVRVVLWRAPGDARAPQSTSSSGVK